jgi:hypothetical protein
MWLAASGEGSTEASGHTSGNARASGTEDKSTPMPIDRNAQVVVLGYHRVVDKVRHPDTEITPRAFEAQMQQIKDAGSA